MGRNLTSTAHHWLVISCAATPNPFWLALICRFQCNAIELDSLANPALPGTACRESGHCECQEEWDFLVEDDESFIFNKILRPAFARAVCAALAISPFKIADEKVLSFAMSQHSRLGKRSCAFGLPSEIISRIVFASESLDPCA